ncbi:MAG: DUF2062 domain-containing protein [Nanoarchaeota archaeon]|nr:DUF2062 domain-containing protein [Nanoarchaeota archaeon]
MKKIIERLKWHFHEVLKTKKSAHSIALGFAIGTFIAVLPTFGFGLLVGFLIILIFKRVNKFSLIGAFIIWNPLTLALLYYLSYELGNLLFGPKPLVNIDLTIFEQAYHFTLRFLVGNAILAVIFAVTSYFLVRKIVMSYQKRET